MFNNYLKIAWRNFRKHKTFSLINIAGLAVGMACFILIMLYVQYELSFDRFHEKADRIYRVVVHQPQNVYLGSDHFAVTQAILAKTLKTEFPEVLESVTIDKDDNVLISVGGQSFYENNLVWADAPIFEIFTFPLLLGDPQGALAEPFAVVLCETLARKYFGEENPLGKAIRYQDQHDFKVTGVMRDTPKNSHFQADMLVSFQTLIAMSDYKDQFSQWGSSSYYTYILVPKDFDPKAFEAKLLGIVKKYHTEEWRVERPPHRYYLQRLTDIHLYSHINFDIGKNNDIRYIYLLSGLAASIMLTACINYMNLTTARSSLRAKEVGMRKVVGANRLQLLKQFIGESMLLAITAAFIALLAVELFLPIFSKLVERELTFALLLQGKVFISLFAAIFLVGMISGSYPAIFLTAFQPVKVLKGEIRDSGRSRLRSALVEGRNFSKDFPTDSTQAFIVNEKLRDLLGWESAAGKPFGRNDTPDGTVIGVMKNFHLHSFRQEIHPLFIQLGKSWSWYASARIRGNDIPGAIEHARKVWQKYSASYPFDYFFLDDEFNRMYKTEEKLSAIFGYFTSLAIFIACLGLFGLASFTAERKTKEIGIRKVLGASVGQLLLLLSKDFVKLVMLANLVAWPIVWYAMNQWLQGFAYRISLGWTMFFLTTMTALLIALFTVSLQTIKAALANPIDALRYE